MTVFNAFGARAKHHAMQDTWGHIYPEPGRKYPGYVVFSVGDYGDSTILQAEFEGLPDSPQKAALATSILNHWEAPTGLYRVDCELWFFKSCHDMYLGEAIGRPIKQKITTLWRPL